MSGIRASGKHPSKNTLPQSHDYKLFGGSQFGRELEADIQAEGGKCARVRQSVSVGNQRFLL